MKYSVVFVVVSLFIMACAVSWVVNFVDAVHLIISNSPVTTLFICRLIGIFIPVVGSVLGVFG